MLSSRIMGKESIRNTIIKDLEEVVVAACRDTYIQYHQSMSLDLKFEGNSSDVILLIYLGERGSVSVDYDYPSRRNPEFNKYHKSPVILLDDSVSFEDLAKNALLEFRNILKRKSFNNSLDAIVKHQLKLRI